LTKTENLEEVFVPEQVTNRPTESELRRQQKAQPKLGLPSCPTRPGDYLL
jgi:hypothetical protein